MATSRVKALPDYISVQRSDKIIIKSYKNIGENHGEMSGISLKMSGKIREFFL